MLPIKDRLYDATPRGEIFEWPIDCGHGLQTNVFHDSKGKCYEVLRPTF